MKHTLTWSLLAASLFIGCGDESASSTSSGTGGAASGGACSAECATTGCADSSPDQACGDCAEAKCGGEIGACVADAVTCGNCSACGALLTCNECSDQGDLDAEGKALFAAILTCMCGS